MRSTGGAFMNCPVLGWIHVLPAMGSESVSSMCPPESTWRCIRLMRARSPSYVGPST